MNRKGQTVVEYMLVLMVILAVACVFARLIKGYTQSRLRVQTPGIESK